MSDDLHVGDTGTVFLVTILDGTVPVDLTSGSVGSNYILFRKPDTSTMQKSASFYNDGTDGKIKYVSVDGDLDQAGTWKISANVNTSTGKWTASAVEFLVKGTFS